ncbi:DUF805 domain-containing protein [Shewanella psychropiezotolerans]|uniref:DUF805 domain-containing protein n=1 Tax=Shewanella psychropiezotolerans TaxID=2593655 RepID=A0ABX5X473_9GAMM|nr:MULTISPECIES: DUF805 domain-containing protein [Shewanella]MPY26475.1 DUF805 domain-containing protein [Shewanella sp. YLB-07]QDO86141.1 DUF805 domain-containing protein [Shewanella psychropiezotolerans]
MQYQSLFCFKGRDNGARFAVISASVYFILALGFVLLGQSAALLVLGCLLAPVLGLSAYRRMRDAARPTWYACLILIPLLLFSMTLVYAASLALAVVILVIAVLLSLFFARLAPVGKATFYHQGYVGPAVTTGSSANRRRVEPSLGGHVGVADLDEYDAEEPHAYEGVSEEDDQQWKASSPQKFSDSMALKQWTNWAKLNKKLLLGVVAGLGVLVLIGGLLEALSSDNQVASELVQERSKQVPVPVRGEAKIPDGFSVLLENDVLIIRWLGERRAEGEIWSLASAQGDSSCANLSFNDGSNYRPMLVEYMPDTSIEARFSPLDTQGIISDIAMRGSIKLCGYDFSLKGSQSALAKNAAFIPYL